MFAIRWTVDHHSMSFPEQCECSGAGYCRPLGRTVTVNIAEKCASDCKFRALLAKSHKPKPPGLLRKAANFAIAGIKHIAAGMPATPPEELERRRAICLACDQWVNGQCAKCGCNVAAKTAWARETCPLGRWELPVVN